jgi:hypothetical protein
LRYSPDGLGQNGRNDHTQYLRLMKAPRVLSMTPMMVKFPCLPAQLFITGCFETPALEP